MQQIKPTINTLSKQLAENSFQMLQNKQYLQQNTNNDNTFTILSYNILASCFSILPWYPKTEESLKYFDFEYRKTKIIEKIHNLNSDIICLQEVDNFSDFYEKQLENLGYTLIYQLKHKREEGILFGYKKSKFSLINHEILNFNDQTDDFSNLSKNYRKPSKFQKPTVAIFAELKCNQTQKLITICTTHIHYDLSQSYIKYYQICKILQILYQKYQDNPKQNIIIAGDLNSVLKSDITALLKNQTPPSFDNLKENIKSYIKPEHMKVQESLFEVYKKENGLLYFKFQEVYDEILQQYQQEQKENNFQINDGNRFTLFKTEEQLVLDYIYYNKNSEDLKVKSILQLDSLESFQKNQFQGIIPSQNEGSDHLPILCEFYL